MAKKQRALIQNRLTRSLPIICTDGSTKTIGKGQRAVVDEKVLDGYHYKSLEQKRFVRKIKDMPPPAPKAKKAEAPKAEEAPKEESKPAETSSRSSRSKKKKRADEASLEPKDKEVLPSDVKDGEA